MVRDLAKSALSFSWALSLLGVKQAVNIVTPGRQSQRDVFAPITQIAVDQLDESMKNIYRSGDNLQARTVDMAFACLNPTNWMNPADWARAAGTSDHSGGGNSTGTGSQQPWYATGTTGPESRCQSRPAGIVDTALFWINPLNWVNLNTWNPAGGGDCTCGQAVCRCGQVVAGAGQAMGQAAAAFAGSEAGSGDGSNASGAYTSWGAPKTGPMQPS